jgi:hypothetical protein
MDTPLGAAAGRIWQYLAEEGEATLLHRQRGATLPARLLRRGVGGLAREDTRCLVQEWGVLQRSLREL